MKAAVTVALDPCFAAGPFVFHDLPQAVEHARRLRFDALELFPGEPQSLPKRSELGGLAVSAVGTGAGWVKHKLSLSDPDADARRRAVGFVRELRLAAADLGAPVIVGSMQGRWGDGAGKRETLDRLGESLRTLAADGGPPLLFEPLNRYESNLLNTLDAAARFLDGCDLEPSQVGILADLFHMNIEEVSLAGALRAVGEVGHVHLADSNRRPAGMGHTDFAPVVAALRDIGYAGYLSAECFPYPDPVAAAEATMAAVRRLV